ncbi:AAA family ATPase [Paenibacillus sp. IB182496]|uniref:AAA family ATPase n=1 Tax=Paenibacillus sabuli TaxID=2772509 RepID=A0A927BV41_9BACL|nr:AAA family ATPase [Paenibacillus sabuli]MBD2846892.1 AAA family ATPase [Paenibacillus sabuli]
MNTAFLRWVELDRSGLPAQPEYPFDLPVLHQLERLAFHPKVTYLIGENGIGKSTLMEALAVACGFNPEGGGRNLQFATRATHSELHAHLRLARGVRTPRDGYFFRAESYYNVATRIDELDAEPSFGAPIRNAYGGRSLHEMSHGESFFATFMHRFGGRGLYLLDEPEAALSPLRQMAMLSQVHELVRRHSQFVIATHSPILMAYPDAAIYTLSPEGIVQTPWEETEHYVITKQFLNHTDRMLGELLQDE